MNKFFATNNNRNFTDIKQLIWLLLMELEKELKDLNGDETCTDRTMWDILCEVCAPNLIVFCECLFFVSYIG
jgi:hypothetical protein